MLRASAVALALLTPVAASAQGLQFGAKAGLTLTSVFGGVGRSGLGSGGTASVDSSGRGGFVVGLLARAPVSDRLTVQVEATLARKSQTVRSLFRVAASPASFGLAGLAIDLDVDYLQLPVTLQYRFSDGATRPYVLAGGGLDVKIGAGADAVSRDFLTRFGFLDRDVSERVRGAVPFLAIGVGLDLGAHRRSGWTIETRYDFSLRSAIDDLPPPPGAEFRSDTKLGAFLATIVRRF